MSFGTQYQGSPLLGRCSWGHTSSSGTTERDNSILDKRHNLSTTFAARRGTPTRSASEPHCKEHQCEEQGVLDSAPYRCFERERGNGAAPDQERREPRDDNTGEQDALDACCRGRARASSSGTFMERGGHQYESRV